jgi:hypothetical protein
MADDAQPNRRLIEKVSALPPIQAAAVEAFVDTLPERELVKAAQVGSQASFAATWDEAEDAVYDEL